MTTDRILRSQDSLNQYAFALNAFVGDGRIETGAEGILTEHTNGEGVAGGCNFGGPFNEFAKVIQVGSLDLILSRAFLLGMQA